MAERGGTTFQALRRGLCPVCRSGRIFAGRWRMNETCPVCQTRFERAPGYFVGAMYLSYALSAPILIAIVSALLLADGSMPVGAVVILAFLGYLPFVPAVFRWSRILWIYVGHRIAW